MASQPAGPRRDRERELVRATRRLFDERGMQDAPVEEIAKAVGIARGLIYRYFSSKEELYVLTVTDYLGELDEALRAAADPTLGHIEQLERWGVAYVDFCLRYPAFLDCALYLMHRPARELREGLSESVWFREAAPPRHDARMSSGYRVLHAADAFWRPSNATGVPNTDLAKQLGTDALGARLWRLGPGQTVTKHRHRAQTELYLLLEGTGRVRIGHDVLTLEPLSALVVEPRTVRQVFNDTDADALWLVCGAPSEPGNTLEMTPESLADLYPDGLTALPPELPGAAD